MLSLLKSSFLSPLEIKNINFNPIKVIKFLFIFISFIIDYIFMDTLLGSNIINKFRKNKDKIKEKKYLKITYDK